MHYGPPADADLAVAQARREPRPPEHPFPRGIRDHNAIFTRRLHIKLGVELPVQDAENAIFVCGDTVDRAAESRLLPVWQRQATSDCELPALGSR
jgi:hypothetical protein